MKVLHISKTDVQGGAAKAAYRLHKGLLDRGVDSQMLVLDKLSDEPTVIGASNKLGKGWGKIRSGLDMLPLELYRRRQRVPYSPHWLPSKIHKIVESRNPDIINLHWIGGYFPVEAIAKFNRPIIWTLHDMWGFTGGCHYSQECDRYTESCGKCPILQSSRDYDLSRWLWQRKAKAWQNIDLTIVTPSKWLAKCAKTSSLFRDLRIEVIPNGLDIDRYKPIDRQQAKNWLGLPQDKQIILFGAVSATRDLRKGFHLLLPALQKLQHYYGSDCVELVVFGSSQPSTPLDLNFKVHYLGKLQDDIAIALLYAAADVMVVPSSQEAFGQTASEAMSCGTPVVAFNTTGLQDIIDSERNGYLATPYDPQDLARGIVWILEDVERWHCLSARARAKAIQEFTVQLQADRYFQLFQDTLAN